MRIPLAALLRRGGPMPPPDPTSHADTVALFRYGLIADLLHLPAGDRSLHVRLREKAAREYDIPGTTRRRVAAETLRDWLYAYRRAGFDGLKPRVRADHGHARALPQAVADQLCALKEAHPTYSVALIIATARQQGVVPPDVPLALATVHRLLSRQGLMARPTEAPTSKDRRRFSYDAANELWMSDVMHGPTVLDPDDRRRHKTYLIALLDDATRLIPYAAFTRSETVTAFLPVFERAILRRGIPKRLYVDNGSAYRARHLALVCAKLGVTLIHARPFAPQGKGKLERWFRTVRLQLLPTLLEADTRSLDALNQRLWTWIEDEYLDTPHRGLQDATPREQWARAAHHVTLPTQDLTELFLFEEKRKVQHDRTVSLHGVVFEVDAAFVGQTVTLRFDPTRLTRGVTVVVNGRACGTAKRVDAYANCFVRRDHGTKLLTPSTASAPAPGLPLRKLDEDF
jgi:transposase InsO family protein